MAKKKSPASSRKFKRWKKTVQQNRQAQNANTSKDEMLQQAMSLLQSGQPDKARLLLEDLLEEPDSTPTYLNQLGILAHMLGESETALKLLQRSTALQPTAPFFNNLGLVQEQTGNLDSAQISYEQAIRHDQGMAQAHFNLGNVLHKKLQFEAAIREYEEAIRLDHGYAKAYANLGHLLYQRGLPFEAEICFRNCLNNSPPQLPSLLNLMTVLFSLGKYEDAISFADKALALESNNFDALKTIILSLQGLGETAKAIEYCQHAISVRADKTEMLSILGNIYESFGDRSEAARLYRQALTISPDNGGIHWKLSRLLKYEDYNDHVRQMEALFGEADSQQKTPLLCMALGKAFEDLGDYAKAFRYIDEGNKLLRSTYQYNLDNERLFFTTLKSIFTPDFLKKSADEGCPDPCPIFIIGMPRSGTTLVEQILSSHPEVHGSGERRELDLITREVLHREQKVYPQGIQELSPGRLSDMGSEYVKRLRRLAPHALKVTNKMPHNFLWVGLIHCILPNASIIHCQRDPMDTCWSNFKNIFDPPHLYAQDLEELGTYYHLFQDMMKYWRTVLPGRMYEIDYEQLVQNQEEETGKLLEYCNLEWNDSCLTFYTTDREVLTSSMSQIRHPIYTSSIGKWRHFEQDLQPLLKTIYPEGIDNRNAS